MGRCQGMRCPTRSTTTSTSPTRRNRPGCSVVWHPAEAMTGDDVRDAAHASRLPSYFAIYTPDVGHVPCVFPSVTSDAALGNCEVALVFTAIHASVK